MKKKWTSVLLIFALLFTMGISSLTTASAASYTQTRTAMELVGERLYQTVNPPSYGTVGGEWVIYGLGLAGHTLPDSYLDGYQATVEQALKEGYRGVSGILHDRKYTEYSRVIVAYTAAGLDPTNVAGVNLLTFLADFDQVVWQGINGPIWALRALDGGDYAVPAVTGIDHVTTRQKLIDYILDAQLVDGGWALSGNTADPDLTGMAIGALAPYKKQNKVKNAVSMAVSRLSALQQADGGYKSWGTDNAESCAQVICGLVYNGINPNTDSRFKKNGKSVIDGLMAFYDEKAGGFRHVNVASGGYEPTVNQMATEQAYYSLATFYRYVPAQTVWKKVTAPKKGQLKATWKKTAGASGYQVLVATNKGFTKNVKRYTVSSKHAVKTVTGLKKGTRYVKVRAYQVVNGTRLYGLYSPVKKVVIR